MIHTVVYIVYKGDLFSLTECLSKMWAFRVGTMVAFEFFER